MYKDIIDTIGYVEKVDPELGAAMDRELGRQHMVKKADAGVQVGLAGAVKVDGQRDLRFPRVAGHSRGACHEKPSSLAV